MTEQMTPAAGQPDPAQPPRAGQPGYPQQPGAYPPPAPQRGNGLAVAGFVIALVGFLLCLIPIVNIFAIVLAVVGLVLGILGLVKTRKGAPRKGLAIAGIVLAVLGGVGGTVSAIAYGAAADAAVESLDEATADLDKMTGDATEDVLANDLSLELGDFKASTDEFGLVDSSMSVKVTNTADERMSFNATVEAVDADGNRLAEDYVIVNDLAPGQSKTVEIFQVVTEDEAAQLKDATFQVVEASSY